MGRIIGRTRTELFVFRPVRPVRLVRQLYNTTQYPQDSECRGSEKMANFASESTTMT